MKIVRRAPLSRSYAVASDNNEIVGEIYSRPKGRSFSLWLDGWYFGRYGWNRRGGGSGRSFATLRQAKAEAEMLVQWSEL